MNRTPMQCEAIETAMIGLRSAQAAHPRFASTVCSRCGTDTGPGDAGFSRCAEDRQRDADRALFGTIARAVQPTIVAQRFACDGDCGAFDAHPSALTVRRRTQEAFPVERFPAIFGPYPKSITGEKVAGAVLAVIVGIGAARLLFNHLSK